MDNLAMAARLEDLAAQTSDPATAADYRAAAARARVLPEPTGETRATNATLATDEEMAGENARAILGQIRAHLASATPNIAELRKIASGAAIIASSTTDPQDDDYRAQAKAEYERDGEIEIDDNAVVSIGVDGAYVQAWVFVRKIDDEQEATA